MNKNYVNLLKPLFEEYSCSAGTSVIQQGAPADYIYLVLEGKAEVSFKPYDGIPITVSHVGKDGLFGWSALVGSQKYTSSVRAIEALRRCESVEANCVSYVWIIRKLARLFWKVWQRRLLPDGRTPTNKSRPSSLWECKTRELRKYW